MSGRTAPAVIGRELCKGHAAGDGRGRDTAFRQDREGMLPGPKAPAKPNNAKFTRKECLGVAKKPGRFRLDPKPDPFAANFRRCNKDRVALGFGIGRKRKARRAGNVPTIV